MEAYEGKQTFNVRVVLAHRWLEVSAAVFSQLSEGACKNLVRSPTLQHVSRK